MGDAIRVLVVGTGQMGAGVVRLVLEKRGLELAGACARRPERCGVDLGRAVGLEHDLRIAIEGDLEAQLERLRPDVAIQTTCSRLDDARAEIEALVRAGVHVISIAEEMAWPGSVSAGAAEHIDRLAREHGVTVLGTGVNPGFVLDLLVVALSGVCWDVERIRARRVNDLAAYGPSVLRAQGVGLGVEAFRQGVESGDIVGHVGFPQSIQLIAHSVGWEIERIEETREPIVSTVERETPFVRVAPGRVAGCRHTAIAYSAGRPVIELEHPQQVHPELEGVATVDAIEIEGRPPVRLSGSPEIPGGLATVALAVNAIPVVLGAAPGLASMADLPVPAALLGDARTLVRGARARVGRG